jgi:KamA family protein
MWDMKIVSMVLPFKVNGYVIDELIDWSNVPDDPLFQLTFPHRDMISPDAFATIAEALDAGLDGATLRGLVGEIRRGLNPNPGEQLESNVPTWHGRAIPGLQHKYRETVLVFPRQGQTCHAYCSYCFRWAQFVGDADLRQAVESPADAWNYLAHSREVTDVLFTGGDPMIMSTQRLKTYVQPLLESRYSHIQNIRFGTKALSYWPYRFTHDEDADELLQLFSSIVERGKHVAVMAHVSHERELSTTGAMNAIQRLRECGATIHAQAPVIRHVNDSADQWANMWQRMVNLGISPYYMFVERDTGASRYFQVTLNDAFRVYTGAISQVSGLARTARGPVMSASAGKILIDGMATHGGQSLFCCRFLQARRPEWVGRPFFAAFDPDAVWIDDLKPASGEPWFWQDAS